MASSFNLSGRVILEGGSAIKTSEALASRLEALSKNGRTTAATLKTTAQAMDAGARAAKNEAAALSTLTIAQQKANAVQRESLAASKLTRARTGAVVSGAADRTAIAEGQTQLLQNRALTETIRQRIAVENAEATNRSRLVRDNLAQQRVLIQAGRAQVAAQEADSRASARIQQQKIASQRLTLAQQVAASRAEAAAITATHVGAERAATALGHVGSTALHISTISGALFVGLAANAVIMERQFANVVRTSDILDRGLSKVGQNKAIAKLSLQFDSLATQLPVSYKELTEIGAAANQLGVRSESLASFTKTVAQFSSVTGVSVDTASTAFGRLNSLIVDVNRNGHMVGGVNDDFQGLADSINKVGVNSVATDQQIINIASQISGIANAAGLGYKDIVGFSGALASVNISPYLARGLTTRLFTNINNAVSEGGANLEKFAVTAGLSADQFAKAWKADPQTALTDLFDGIRSAGPDAVEVLKNLGVTSVLDQPALVRLANAADKFGKSASQASRSGGILRQTFDDANTAAGENARQYSVIASTVDSKLKVALNRVQILFRNIGDSNLGPLGDAIDTIASGALKLGQSLDKPVKLLGSIDLPFTTGQALGFATLATGFVAVLTLVVGIGAKIVQAFIRLRTGAAAIAGAFGQARGALTQYTAAALGATTASNELALASGRVAESKAASQLTTGMVNYQTGLARATLSTQRITAATSAFGTTGGRVFTAYNNGVNKLQSSSSGVVRTLGNLGRVGQTAALNIGNGLNKVSSLAGRAKTGLGNAARGAGSLAKSLGPALVVTGLLVAVDAASNLNDKIRAAGTSADAMSDALKNAGSQAELLSKIKIASPIGFLGAGGLDIHAFAKDAADLNKQLKGIGGGGFLNDFSKITFGTGAGKVFGEITSGLDKVKQGFAGLASNGEVDSGIAGLQNFFKGVSQANIGNALGHMGDTTAILTQRLNEAGISAGKNDINVKRLLAGTLQLNDASSKAARSEAAVTNAFKDNAAAAQEYLTAVKPAADASVDLNKAFQSAGKGNNQFGDFIKNAKKNYQDFVDFQKNALIVAHDTGASLAELSALDPGILSGAVKSGKKGEQQLADVLELKDAKDAFTTAIAELDNDPKLLGAFTGLGKSAQEKVATALGQGASIPDAFRLAGQQGVDAFNKAVEGTDTPKIKLQVDGDALKNSLDNLTSKQAKTLQVKIAGDAGPAIQAGEDASTIISNLKPYIIANADTLIAQQKGESAAAYISRLQSTITVLGDDAPARQTGESVDSYIGALQATMSIAANPALANATAAQTRDQISSLRSTFNIDGNPIPAQGKGESARDYITRLKAILQIDANAAAGIGKGRSAAAQISQLKGIITILGVDAPVRRKGEGAKAYIDRLKGTISILGNDSGARSKTNGAVSYANGKTGTIRVGANTSAAESAINYVARPRTANILLTTSGAANLKATQPAFFRAAGGPVWGRGTETSDSIPAMLSNGEYVVRARQARKYGSLLHAINSGIGGFASGGKVTQGSAKYQDTPAALMAPAQRQAEKNGVYQITELSTYDRHLLTTIANNIGFTIAPDHIASATNQTYTAQARRGNG